MGIPCTGGRVIRDELLDSAEPHLVHENLRDLVRINRWFGGHRILLHLLAGIVRGGESFRLLDVGAASGDMAGAVRRRFPNAQVVSLDYKELHLARAPEPRVAADAFALPFPQHSFDIVYCSLFLHHFTNEEAAKVLSLMFSRAHRALIAVDLERHPLAYYFLPATRWLFGWGELAVHDGKISVEAAWKPEELRRLAADAGLPDPRVRRHLPWFRLSLVSRRM